MIGARGADKIELEQWADHSCESFLEDVRRARARWVLPALDADSVAAFLDSLQRESADAFRSVLSMGRDEWADARKYLKRSLEPGACSHNRRDPATNTWQCAHTHAICSGNHISGRPHTLPMSRAHGVVGGGLDWR